jgi:hypothetical protein
MSWVENHDRGGIAKVLSEVLMIHDNQFVVRVTIETMELGQFTGLAADFYLEEAEDRARARAFSTLSLTSPHQTSVSNPLSTVLPEDVPELPPVSQSEGQKAASPAETQLSRPPVLPSSLASQCEPSSQNEAPSSDLIKDGIASVPLASHQAPEQLLDLVESPKLVLPPPVDLSDVIAQTGIELRRLGWTVEDGRKYLQETYQKNSRHELTEEELIEFLCYLESLPAPTL